MPTIPFVASSSPAPHGGYPHSRLRRLRQAPWARELMAETQLTPSDLVLPLFIQEGEEPPTPIEALPKVFRYSITQAVAQARQAEALGIPMVALFPCVPSHKKSPSGQEAYNPNNLACQAIKAIKAACPNVGVMVDVALDLYTSHGHDGLLQQTPKGPIIANDATVQALCQQALCLAEAGADALGPSDMMDGRVGAIRSTLERFGFEDTLIVAYSAKYASALYGPYRAAVGSQGHLASGAAGASKATYQQHPANAKEALREGAQDVAEGADVLMVKPGTFYLDIIHTLSHTYPLPVWAYHVSGEYAMIEAAAERGWIDGPAVLHEALLSLKRAGAGAILCYGAVAVAQTLVKSH